MDEWVSVWFWLRFLRSQRVMDPLPQMDWRNPEAMSDEEYELLRLEWIGAGAPRATPARIIAAMGGVSEPVVDALHEPPPF